MNLIVIAAGLALFCMVMWDFCRYLPPEQVPQLRRWFKIWTFKGLVVPFVLWIVFNSAAFGIPPLMPAVEFAKMNGNWADMMEYVATLGLFVVSSYWAALTVAWLLSIMARQAAEPIQVRHCILTWSAVLLPMAALIIYFFGWRLAGMAVTLWLLPVLQQVLALQPERKVAPIYTRAIVALNFDKHEEAEQAVIEELESCEDDFEGWMMLAELYANQFNDLAGACELLRETCEHPGITPSQFAVAHHRIADWQLKLGQDTDAARAALTAICRRHPKSHLDRMARLRINQLPANREEWMAKQSVKKIALPSLRGEKKNSPATQKPEMSREEAFARSQKCVQLLQEDPDNINVREELARLWAEELGQIEMGADQLNLLLSMPGVASAKAAEWLGWLASWHLQLAQNPAAARAAMERLVRYHPHSPQGIAAQRRLKVMDLENRMRQTSSVQHDHA